MPEINDNSTYTAGKRSNRYLKAGVNWSTYPKGVVLACRGTKDNYDDTTTIKCGTVKYVFLPENCKKSDNPIPKYALNRCGKLACNEDGMFIASKRARRLAPNFLAMAKISGNNNLTFLSMNIDMKLDKFKFRKNESFEKWAKRTRNTVAKNAKEAGMHSFSLILHADRIKIRNGYEGIRIFEREWDPHYHLIGFGYIIDSNDFYKKYGYTYRQQKKLDLSKKDDLKDLVARISYRLNHSAFYRSKSGRASDSIVYYGGMSNGKLSCTDEIKLKSDITDDYGNRYVAVEVPKEAMKFETPFKIKMEIKSLKIAMKKAIIKQPELNGYYPPEMEKRYNSLKELIFPKNLEMELNFLEKGYKFPYKLSQHTGMEICLYEVETVKRFFHKDYGIYTVVSSNDFIPEKESHYAALDPKFSMETRVKAVHDSYMSKPRINKPEGYA